MTKTNRKRAAHILLALAILVILAFPSVIAIPAGAGIIDPSTDTGPTYTAESSTTVRSTITTMLLNATMQTPRWKAYVGNVSGLITLDDSSNNTIYDWTGFTVSGEVLATRDAGISFTALACANATNIGAEHTDLEILATDVESVTNTFDSTIHNSTKIATATLTNCSATSLYVNSASQGHALSNSFQEFIIQDNTTDSLIYAALINDDVVGYNGQTYDFQLIVPENPTTNPAHAYYFYVELG